MPVLVKIPNQRFIQLQEIAKSEGMQIADTIALLIKQYKKHTGQPNSLPGWNITSFGNQTVLFESSDLQMQQHLTFEVALSVAETLEKYSSPGQQASSLLDVDTNIRFDRRGTSVKLTNLENSKTVTLARSIARDVADLLRDATKEEPV